MLTDAEDTVRTSIARLKFTLSLVRSEQHDQCIKQSALNKTLPREELSKVMSRRYSPNDI